MRRSAASSKRSGGSGKHTFEDDWPDTAGEPLLVAQMDGGMVPIVVADDAQADRRKGKRLEWKAR